MCQFDQNEVGKGVCEFHIFDPGNYGHMIPPELERAHYHRWGLAKQKANEGSSASANCPSSKMGGNNYCGLRDTIKQLGHDKLDAIDSEYHSCISEYCLVLKQNAFHCQLELPHIVFLHTTSCLCLITCISFQD